MSFFFWLDPRIALAAVGIGLWAILVIKIPRLRDSAWSLSPAALVVLVAALVVVPWRDLREEGLSEMVGAWQAGLAALFLPAILAAAAARAGKRPWWIAVAPAAFLGIFFVARPVMVGMLVRIEQHRIERSQPD